MNRVDLILNILFAKENKILKVVDIFMLLLTMITLQADMYHLGHQGKYIKYLYFVPLFSVSSLFFRSKWPRVSVISKSAGPVRCLH